MSNAKPSSDKSLVQWLATLAPAEQALFQQLQARLTELGSDASLLNADERAQLQSLATRYAASLGADETVAGDAQTDQDESDEIAADVELQYAKAKVSPALMRTPFAGFVRSTLLAELCKHGGQLSDAIVHAFNTKWLPESLRDSAVCARVYQQYQADIDTANAFREAVPVAKDLSGDKVLAVGLAWFSYVFRMHELIVQGLDLDRVD